MGARRKPFRIETMYDATPAGDGSAHQHERVMDELHALQRLMQPREELAEQMIDAYRAEMADGCKLKAELDAIQTAIADTKHELATLHLAGCEGPKVARVTDELDAVVEGTECATDQILSAAEFIELAAAAFAASSKRKQDRVLASEVRSQVVRILEACSFQDITGQRIAKVVATFKFIEDHVGRMIEIWGGIDAFNAFSLRPAISRHGEGLLNGPKLPGEQGHASQSEIDALFA